MRSSQQVVLWLAVAAVLVLHMLVMLALSAWVKPNGVMNPAPVIEIWSLDEVPESRVDRQNKLAKSVVHQTGPNTDIATDEILAGHSESMDTLSSPIQINEQDILRQKLMNALQSARNCIAMRRKGEVLPTYCEGVSRTEMAKLPILPEGSNRALAQQVADHEAHKQYVREPGATALWQRVNRDPFRDAKHSDIPRPGAFADKKAQRKSDAFGESDDFYAKDRTSGIQPSLD
ncbi:hypothetical protein [Asticcacaulis endophyticus]|uniref:Uncharacterized protein n=1 Tax=Asticcacaulis endophyticus TaxID=1395890 RepID=A0A918UVZ0_9CAUL|nr:hypothetical protein [Asticcacaulis endophyticus]GGZ36778.1 hypothetical protein GCM10011273_23910 [Asticcacaulis endophyticus]